jgi:hypothetical protein
MTKKRLNTESIANELEGASVFFTRPQQSTPPPQEELASPAINEQPAAPTPAEDGKQTRNEASNITGNITILQLLRDSDIADLREPAYQAQTFRLTQKEIEWVKDTAYNLSKEMKRRKISQADVLRLSLKLFDRLLATQKAELLAILERIK